MTSSTRPHPKEPQILALLQQGLSNAEVMGRLHVGSRAVVRVRETASIPPLPRSAWRRRPHPQDREITALLDEGYTDAEIRRRTGADVSTVARRRKDGGFGPATIRPTPPRRHPREDEIRARLRTMSNSAIAMELGVDRAAVRRIRGEAGIRYTPPQYATAEEKWTAHVRPVDGGHLEWTGERAKRTGTPVMRFREKSTSPAGIAFRRRTGRPPVGQVRAECGYPHCMAPEHVEDEHGRLRTREQLRYLTGGTERPPFCRHGHDQAVEGRYEPDGTAYCNACKREQKRPTP